MNIIDELNKVKSEEYKEFQSKLVPNISKDIILGVKTPEMRSIAKKIFVSKDCDKFLNDLPHKYYEENLVHSFVISMIKDFDECINKVEEFLPYVDCWPVSDQATPISFKRNHEKLLPYIYNWIGSIICSLLT